MPSPLNAYYDQLARHDWFYEYSDDPSVYRAGQSERSALQAQAQRDPAAKALYEAYSAYIHDTSKPCPPRPADTGIASPPPVVVTPLASALEDLDPADQKRVRAAKDPMAELALIQDRQALDTQHAIATLLPQLGARQDDRNPRRWTFPDGAVAMVNATTQAWVEQKDLAVGQGAVALIRRLCHLDEASAMTALRAGVYPSAESPALAPLTPPSIPPIAPVPEPVMPTTASAPSTLRPRFHHRPR